MSFKTKLRTINACSEAIEWVGSQSLKTAWTECERADWMLWLAARARVDRRLIGKVAVDCALSVLHLNEDTRVSECINVVEAWCAGEATIEEVRVARRAAAAAYAASAAAAYAALAAAYAAADDDAAAAADAAAYAAADARKQSLREMADLVRERITWQDVRDALAEVKS